MTRRIAFAVAAAALAVVVANLALGIAWVIRDSQVHSQLVDLYGLERMAKSYPGWRSEDLFQLLVETDIRNRYEPFVQFRPSARNGRFVHVREEGFRETRPGQPWPPDRTTRHVLFFFGGSTSFGSNVPDGSTIAARLGEELRAKGCAVDVYNFGRPDYFSTQERILFVQLANAGQVPDVALFFDGLNDFHNYDGRPTWTEELIELTERDRASGALAPAAELLSKLPLSRTMALLSRKLSADAAGSGVAYDDPRAIDQTIRRWTANMRALRGIANEYGVALINVVQPVPTYGYDLSAHTLAEGHLEYFRGHLRSHYGYAALAARRADGRLPQDVLWLADLQRDRHESLYTDFVHYTEAFSREIAAAIAAHVLATPALRQAAVCDASADALATSH